MAELRLSGEDLYEMMGSFLQSDIDCRMKIQCIGYSMVPFIRDKSILTLKPVNNKRLIRNGDIVVTAIHEERKIIVHRIIKITLHEYLIKGDNNRNSDGWFNKKNIIGVVEKIENKPGLSYSPRHWQNKIIALASRTNVLPPAYRIVSSIGRSIIACTTVQQQ